MKRVSVVSFLSAGELHAAHVRLFYQVRLRPLLLYPPLPIHKPEFMYRRVAVTNRLQTSIRMNRKEFEPPVRLSAGRVQDSARQTRSPSCSAPHTSL